MAGSFLDSLNDGTSSAPAQGAGVTDVVIQLQGIIRQLQALTTATNSVATAIAGRVLYGNFTTTAAATVTVNTTGVQANSIVSIFPANATAATAFAGKSYSITISAGTSFTVTFSTAPGTGLLFNYTINTPT